MTLDIEFQVHPYYSLVSCILTSTAAFHWGPFLPPLPWPSALPPLPFPLPFPLPWPPALAARSASVLIRINELLFCIRTIVTHTTYNLTLLNSTANLTLQKVSQNRPFTIYSRSIYYQTAVTCSGQ